MTEKTLAQRSSEISGKLLDSIYLIEILKELNDGEGKIGTLLETICENINYAFKEIEECRSLISISED